VCVYIFD